MYKVSPVETKADQEAWDTYIGSKKTSNYSERIAWRDVMVRTYGLEDRLLMAKRNGAVAGVMQLFINRSILTGLHAVSGPLSSSGGGLYAETPNTLAVLLQHVEAFTKERGLDYLQLRLQSPVDAGDWLEVSDRYVTFIMDLEGGEERVWSEVFRAKTRNQVRKAQSYKFSVRSGHEQIGPFVNVLHKGIKELGSPSPGRKLFEVSSEIFRDKVDFIVVFDRETPIAGSVLFFHKEKVANPWAVTLKKYRPHSANSLLYWEIVRLACSRDMRYFDLGRSLRDSGTYHFKRRLGAEEKPLYYYYYLNRRKSIPIVDDTTKVKSLRRLIWSRLPDIITKTLGGRLIKQLI